MDDTPPPHDDQTVPGVDPGSTADSDGAAQAPPPAEPRPPAGPPSDGPHLATVSHRGHFWDVYIEIVDDPRRTDSVKGRLCFSPADDAALGGPVRTAPILIEPSYQEVIHRARSFEEHQLVGLLRSALPDEEDDEDAAPGS